MKYEVMDNEGVWHEITGFQYAAYQADGVGKDKLRVTQ